MAITQQIRQSQLFAAEDWRVIYTAFTQINFSSYDFVTIRSSMVDYIRINYPEDFNDWIESSEFVAIIDLLAYLGQSLAFRMDLNTRENFLDTATRRSSIFRLARMLSYQPQRSIPASGLLKITSIVSNQPLYDSYGTNLQNTQIIWNDQNNLDWFEQYILVMNATLNSTNTFGNPSKSGLVNNISTDLYEMNNTSIPTSVIPFSTTVVGNNVQMELANVNFNTGVDTNITNSGSFYEIDPDPLNSWSIIYLNDGNGYNSPNTGFFLYFKQGTMQYQDYQCSLALPNRVIDVNADNINQTDVWVQSINTNGLVNTKWTQVPSVNGFNVIYNSLDNNIRNIYSVITRDNNGNDQVSIRFADGNFGNVPTGIIRVWYRVSNNLTYQITPSDISDQIFSFNYVDNLNNTWGVAFTTNLQYTVNNAQSNETNLSIAQNAPQVYYTQDRMINGEDYNLFPLQDARILKIKALNRTYSGQSRYLQSNDPTGYYSDINVFGNDGILYSEDDLNSVYIVNSTSINISAAVSTYIQPLINGNFGNQLQASELEQFFYYNYSRISIPSGYTWKKITSSTTSCTGAFFSGSNAVQIGNYTSVSNSLHYINQGAIVKFSSGVLSSVVSIIGDGAGINLLGVASNNYGAVTLSNIIETGDVPVTVIPSFNTTLSSTNIASISAAMSLYTTFGIRYDITSLSWIVITTSNLSSSDTFSLSWTGDNSNTNKDASWLIKVVWTGVSWKVYSRSMRYIFESVSQNRFYFQNSNKIYDPSTGNSQLDYIDILSSNPNPINGLALSSDYKWQITSQQIYADGYVDPRSVRLTMWQGLNYGVPDNPDEFISIVNTQVIPANMIFWNLITSSDGYQYWQPVIIPINRIYANPTLLPPANNTNWTNGDVAYIISNSNFYQYYNGNFTNVTNTYKMRIGRNNILFLWKHYAPIDQVINPAITNIIDMYVLISSYDTNLRNWISSNGSSTTIPTAPTSSELNSMFSSLDQYSSMSDQIVWHPVSYIILFGSQAAPEYQVNLLVVKTSGTTVTDNEVKSLVIQNINNYFDLSNWDFGQSFFFTELAAYIHQQMATIVGSIVILPLNSQAKFGDLFEINCNPDEIFISGAKVTDVQIVSALTDSILGISNG